MFSLPAVLSLMSWRRRRPAESAARDIARLSAWLKYDGTVITASFIDCSATQTQNPLQTTYTVIHTLKDTWNTQMCKIKQKNWHLLEGSWTSIQFIYKEMPSLFCHYEWWMSYNVHSHYQLCYHCYHRQPCDFCIVQYYVRKI